MKLINASPYDTRALRTIALATYRWMSKQEGRRLSSWDQLKIYVSTKPPINIKGALDVSTRYYIQLPRLSGDEWHHKLRGIKDGKALTGEMFARRIIWWLMRAYGTANARRQLLIDTNWPDKTKKIPEFVPLKPYKEPKPPTNHVQKRYQRTLVLERTWLRKQKLAGTKVKYYRNRRKYYEKKLALQEES